MKYGADFIVAETFGQYGEAKIALDTIKKYGGGEYRNIGGPAPATRKSILYQIPILHYIVFEIVQWLNIIILNLKGINETQSALDAFPKTSYVMNRKHHHARWSSSKCNFENCEITENLLFVSSVSFFTDFFVFVIVIFFFILGVPAVITLTTPPGSVLFDDVSIVEACRQLEEEGAAVVGLNCGRGPATMLPLLEEIKKACKVIESNQTFLVSINRFISW